MKNRRRNVSGEAVAAYLREAATMTNGRTVRETAVLGLKFFPPLNKELRTPEALQALWEEFGDELTPASWLAREIKRLEAE